MTVGLTRLVAGVPPGWQGGSHRSAGALAAAAVAAAPSPRRHGRVVGAGGGPPRRELAPTRPPRHDGDLGAARGLEPGRPAGPPFPATRGRRRVRGAHDLQQGSPVGAGLRRHRRVLTDGHRRGSRHVGLAVSATAAIVALGSWSPSCFVNHWSCSSAGPPMPIWRGSCRSSPPSGMWALAQVFVYWRLARADHRFGPAALGGRDRRDRDRGTRHPQVTGPTGLDALRRRLPGGARGSRAAGRGRATPSSRRGPSGRPRAGPADPDADI